MKSSTLVGVVCALAIVAAMLNAGTPAHAAEPQAVQVSDNCVEEASIGDIRFYFCEGDIGPDFVSNSYGWMWPVN